MEPKIKENRWNVEIEKSIAEMWNKESLYEFDIHDKNAVHLIVVNSKEIIGTGRFYHDKYSGDYKLGRMAIVETYRNQGIGSKMLIKIEEIPRNKKVQRIIIGWESLFVLIFFCSSILIFFASSICSFLA